MRGVAAFLLSTLKAIVGQPLTETPTVLNSFGPQLVLVVRTDSLSNAFLASDGKHSIWCIVTSEALARVREEFPLIENTAGMRGFTVCIEKFRYSTPWRYLAQQRGPITTSRICIVVTELSVIDATSIHVPETPNVLNDHEIINIINQLTLAELEGRLYRKLSNPPPHAYQFNENNKLRISDCIIPPDQLKKLSSASAIVVPQSVLGTRRQTDTCPASSINAQSTNEQCNTTTVAPAVPSSPTNKDSLPNPQSAPIATISSQTNPDFTCKAPLSSNENDAGTQENHEEAPYSQPMACASQPIETNFIPANTENERVSQTNANAVLKHKQEVRLAKLPRTSPAPILAKISTPTITTQAGTSIMRPIMPVKVKKPRKITKNMLPIRPVKAKDFKASYVEVATKKSHTSNVQPIKEPLPKKPSTDSSKAPKTTPPNQEIAPPNDKTVPMIPPSQALAEPVYTSPKKTTNPSEDYFNAISPILPVKQHLSTLELVSMVPSDISTSGSSSPTASTLALTRARLIMPPSSPETQEAQSLSTPQNVTVKHTCEEDLTTQSKPSSKAVPEKPRENEQAEDIPMVENQPSTQVQHQTSNTTPGESQPSGFSQPSSATKENVETSSDVQSAVATSSSGVKETPMDVIDISEDLPSGRTNECIDLTSDEIFLDDDEVVITQVVQSQTLDESPDFYILPSQPEQPNKTSTRKNKVHQVKIAEPPKPDTIVLTGDESELTQMPQTQDFVAPFDQFDGILTQAFDSQETESSHDSQATISSCESHSGNSKDNDLFSMPVPATQLPDTDDGIAYEISTIPPEPEPQLSQAKQTASPEIMSMPTEKSPNLDTENNRELFNLPIAATQPQDTDDEFVYEPSQAHTQVHPPEPIKLAATPNLNLVAGEKTARKTLLEAAEEIYALLSTATKAPKSNTSKKSASHSPQAPAVQTNANVLPANNSRTIPAIVSPQLSYATKKLADGSPAKLSSTNSTTTPHSTPPKPASQSTKSAMIASSPSVERVHLETRKSILSPTLGNQTARKAGLSLSTTTPLSTKLPPKTSSQVRDSSIISSPPSQNTCLAENGNMEKSISFDGAAIATSSPVISQIEQAVPKTTGDTLAPVIESIPATPQSLSPQFTNPSEHNKTLTQASSQNIEVPKHQPVEVTPPSKKASNSNDTISIATTEHFSNEGIAPLSAAERSNIPNVSVPSSVQVSETGKAHASVPTSSVSFPQKEVPFLHTISTTSRNEANAGRVNENILRAAVAVSSLVGENTNVTPASVDAGLDGIQSSSSTGSEAAPSTATLSSDPLNRYPIKFFRYSWTNDSFSIFPIARSKADFDHELRSHYMPSAKRLCVEPRNN